MWNRISSNNKWFVLAVLFLIVNTYGVIQVTTSAREGWIRVAKFSAGAKGLVRDREPLAWIFSSAMALPEEIGHWTTEGPVSIEPAMPGRYCWVSERELKFEPVSAWQQCTPYRALMDDTLADLNGRTLRTHSRFTFQTPPLQMKAVSQVDFTRGRQCVLRLEFNSAPARPQLKDYVSLEDGRGNPIKFDVLGSSKSPVVLLRTRTMHQDERLNVRIKRGLPAADGPLVSEQQFSWSLAVHADLTLQSVKAVSHAHNRGVIEAAFNVPLDMEHAASFIDVSPHVDLSLSAFSNGRASGCNINGSFKPGENYSVTFKKGLRSARGSMLASNLTRRAYFPNIPPQLSLTTSGHYLSPKGNMQIPVSSINVKKFSVTCERIYPNNLVYFAMRQSGLHNQHWRGWAGEAHRGISHITGTRDFAPPVNPNTATETRIDMSDLMGEYGAGAFWLSTKTDKGARQAHLVVVTDIGISIKRSKKDLLVWANSLQSLEPVTGSVVRVYSSANQEIVSGKTDTDGLVHFREDLDDPDNAPFLVTVTRGSDTSYLRLDEAKVAVQGGVGGDAYLASGYEAYVYTDRGVYRPGERCHVKAIVRDRSLAPASGAFPVNLRILRPDGREFRTQVATLSGHGTAEFEVEWPGHALTGLYRLELLVPGSDRILGHRRVSVEAFVPPQLAVSIGPGEARVSKALSVDVSARYLFGRVAARHGAKATVQFRPVPFSHEQWPDYTFSDPERSFGVVNKQMGAGRLDDDGVGRFQFQIPATWRPPSALKAVVGITVAETSGRSVSAYASRMVDMYPYYVGLNRAKTGRHLSVGERQVVDVAAVRPDGAAEVDVASLRMRLSRISWSTVLERRSNNRYGWKSVRRLERVDEREIKLLDGRGQFDFTPVLVGQYLLAVESADAGSSASVQFYAGSPGHSRLAWSKEKPGHVGLELDRETYRPGEVARLLVKSPFPGKALLSIESDHVIESRVIRFEGNTTEIDLPVSLDYAPNVYCTVSVIRPVEADGMWSPHRAVGSVPLKVVNPSNELGVTLGVPDEIRPQSPLKVKIQVTDAGGNGVPAEITVAAVDEGICMLTGFRTPDPLQHFRRQRRLGVGLHDLYSLLMPELADAIAGEGSSPGGDVASSIRGRLNPIKARRFKPVALWRSMVMTDDDGRASVELDVPEFTGELRLMVVAVGTNGFGSASAGVKVKRPLVVVSSLPRFLAPSDRCVMPVTVFNETGRDQRVHVSVQCDGLLTASPGFHKRSIAQGGQSRFLVDVEAGSAPGKARLALTVTAGDERYDETFELAVRPASARITKCGVGVVTPGETETIRLPGGWLKGTEDKSLWCSGLPALTLSGGLDYLLRYPYGCLEQTTSSSFPLLYLADVQAILRPGALGREETTHLVQAGVYRLLSMQKTDGSFAYWPGSSDAYAWGSIYATHFLLEAHRAGIDVPADALTAAVASLQNQLGASVSVPARSNERAWQDAMSNRAYICYVLSLAGKKPAHGWVARLQEQQEALNVSARVNLAAALTMSNRRREAAGLLRSMGVDAASSATRQTSGCLNSGIRNMALLLSTWLDVDPDEAMVPMLASRLNTLKTNGGWRTTQDNAMALMALGKYCRLLQLKQKPFAAEVTWFGESGRVKRQFTSEQDWKLDAGDAGDPEELQVSNEGPGTLYYTWKSAGIPLHDDGVEVDAGLSIRRELLDLNGVPIAKRQVAQGSLVVVRISAQAKGEALHNLVVEDLLPAGLEVENASLKTSQQVPWVAAQPKMSLQHVDVRDDRVLVFINRLKGLQTYHYVARAVSSGTYIHPAISAECMYDPAIRSLHGRGTFVVQAESMGAKACDTR
jgi:uncharacterized protein YfaS (alpha-2-macroglobulin family)